MSENSKYVLADQGTSSEPEPRTYERPTGGGYTLTRPNQKGLKFVDVLLPAPELRNVGIVGYDNIVYRASLPIRREDKLPEGVEPEDINVDRLFQKIRDQKFPPVARREVPAPRFAGGAYTKINKKKPNLKFAPVKLIREESSSEIGVVGADGNLYKAVERDPRKSVMLNSKISGCGRPLRIRVDPRSGKNLIAPSIVTLHVNEKPYQGVARPVFDPIIQVPTCEIDYLVEIMERQYEDQESTVDRKQYPEDEEQNAEGKNERAAEEEENAADEKENADDENENAADENENAADENENAEDENENAEENETPENEEENSGDKNANEGEKNENAEDENKTAEDKIENAADKNENVEE